MSLHPSIVLPKQARMMLRTATPVGLRYRGSSTLELHILDLDHTALRMIQITINEISVSEVKAVLDRTASRLAVIVHSSEISSASVAIYYLHGDCYLP